MNNTIADELATDAARDLFPSMPASAATMSASRWFDLDLLLSNNPSQCASWDGKSPDDFAQMARLSVLESGLTPGVDPVMYTQRLAKQRAAHAKRDAQNKRAKQRDIWAKSAELPTISNPYVVCALNAFAATLDETDQHIWSMKLAGLSQTTIGASLGISQRAVSKRMAKWPDLLRDWVRMALLVNGVM